MPPDPDPYSPPANTAPAAAFGPRPVQSQANRSEKSLALLVGCALLAYLAHNTWRTIGRAS